MLVLGGKTSVIFLHMDKIVIERNGVRHQLVKDKVIGNFCESCSLKDFCYGKRIDLCAAVADYSYHFEIEVHD